VRQAVDALGIRIEAAYGSGFPDHLARSLDFPRLPLVRLEPVHDEGATGAEVGLLDRALEESIRRQGHLRLDVDEAAVPPSLRSGAGEAAPPGLALEAAVDSMGRVRLRLRDLIHDRLLLEANSEPRVRRGF
jgi:hypothetical protein